MEDTWGPCLFTLNQRGGQAIFDISWSPDADRVAVATYHQIQIWNPITGHCTIIRKSNRFEYNTNYFLEDHIARISRVVWSHDGRRLAASGDDNSVTIWDAKDGLCIQALQELSHPVHHISWSHDDRQLTLVGERLEIKIWDTVTEQCWTILEEDKEDPDSKLTFAFSSGVSRLASAKSTSNTVKIWDSSTGRCISVLPGYDGHPKILEWSPDGNKLASAFNNGIIRIWSLSTGDCRIVGFDSFASAIYSMSWSPDGQQLAASLSNSEVHIIDTKSGHYISKFRHDYETKVYVSWSSNGRLASGSLSIKIWDPVDSSSASIKGHSLPIESLSWSPDGTWLISRCNNREVWAWEPKDEPASIFSRFRGVTSHSWSYDGFKLALGKDDGSLDIWDRKSRENTTLRGHADEVRLISWSHDGKLASESRSRDPFKWSTMTINYWDLKTGQCISTFQRRSASSRLWLKETNEIFRFDKNTPNHLHTDIGTVEMLTGTRISTSSECTLEAKQAYGMDRSGSWLTYGNENIIYLPVEFHPNDVKDGFQRYAICETPVAVRVAIACIYGCVITFNFPRNACPS